MFFSRFQYNLKELSQLPFSVVKSISMQNGRDVKAVLDRLVRGINAVLCEGRVRVRFQAGPQVWLQPLLPHQHCYEGGPLCATMTCLGNQKLGAKVLCAICEDLHLQLRGRLGSPTVSLTSTGWATPRWSWSKR